MRRTTRALLATAAATSLVALALPAHASDADPWREVPVDGQVAGTYEPFAGDFNGDGLDDVFFYRPGSGQDYLKLTAPGLEFPAATPTQVRGTYLPLVGDYAAPAGVDDVLWWNPDSGVTYLSVFAADASRVSTRVTPPAGAEPFVLEHSRVSGGAHYDEVLWYNPGSGGDRVDRYRADATGAATISPRTVSINSPWLLTLGDYDANGWVDVAFSLGVSSRPNSRLWSFEGEAGTGSTRQVSSAFDAPELYPWGGRFDGPDGADDLLYPSLDPEWSLLAGPASSLDDSTFGQTSWQQSPLPGEESYLFEVRGARDGDPGRDQILVVDDTRASMTVHAVESGFPEVYRARYDVGYWPLVGDFAGSGRDSVFFYGAGGLEEYVVTRD